MISLSIIVHHKPTLIMQDQSLYSWHNKWQSHQAIDQSSYCKPPKEQKTPFTMQNKPWAQNSHTLPGWIGEWICKARIVGDGKVV